MSALTACKPVAKNKAPRERVDLRGDTEWIARVTAQAERRGLSLSAYIRQAVTKELEQDEATDPKSARATKK